MMTTLREKWAKEFAQNNFRLFRVITTAISGKQPDNEKEK